MVLLTTTRYAPPAHYSLKIENFSSVVKEKIEKYESDFFEAGGYKWRLSVYPNGNEKDGGANHISLYLSIDATKLPLGWEVKIDYKMLVFDRKADKYLCIQDDDGKPWRFHEDNKEWGFAQLIDLPTFKSKYLYNDSCVFGVEIFVVKPTGQGESLSIINNPNYATLKLQIPNFSTRTEDVIYSEVFTIAGHKWKLSVWPKGDRNAEGKNVSMFLYLDDKSSLIPGSEVYVAYQLRVINVSNPQKTHQMEGRSWFSNPIYGGGFAKFLALSRLNESSSGFRAEGDSITFEGQITALSKVTKLYP